jgi:hypothetical protein
VRLNSVSGRYRVRYLLLDVIDFIGGDIDNVGVSIRRTEVEWPGVFAASTFLRRLVDQTTAKEKETVRLVRMMFYEPPKFGIADEICENEKGNRTAKRDQYPAQPAHCRSHVIDGRLHMPITPPQPTGVDRQF